MSLFEAINTKDATRLPSRRDEAWRYSDLRAAIREFPASSPSISRPDGPAPFADIAADQEILVLNGEVEGAGHLYAEAGAPLVIRLRVISHADRTMHQGAFAITLRPDAQVLLIESYEGQGQGYVCDTQLNFVLMHGARLERIVLLDEPADAVSVSQAQVVLSTRAHFAQTVIASGAKLQRHETQLRHMGGEASARLDGLYMLEGRRHADLTTVLSHELPDGTTNQLTKGLAKDQARGVFQGRILVEEGADRTDARMGHHALLLNDGAEIDAKPELEIYADEVSCTHGNTIGSLDDAALFYMRSRGLPEPDARALLMQAFVGEVVERIEHEGARDAVRAWVAQRLEAMA